MRVETWSAIRATSRVLQHLTVDTESSSTYSYW